MRKALLATLVTIGIASGVMFPAQQADAATAAYLTPSGDPMNIACPGNLTLTAEAVGIAGSPLAYDIRSVLNGQSAWVVTPTTFSLPASGVANRTIVVPIPKLTGSNNFLQLDVNPVNAPAITVKVPVACAVPGGDLAVPSGLSRAQTVAGCEAHFGPGLSALPCANAVTVTKQFVLQWNYDQNGCVNKPCAAPDGFNILRSEHGSAYSITDTQNHGLGETAIVFAEPPADVYGSCFEVQARKGGADLGAPSSAYCAVPDPVTIGASNVMTTNLSFHQQETTGGFFSCPASGANPNGQFLLTHNSGQLDVGYIMLDNSCSMTDSLHQGVALFDLTHLLPFKIRNASFAMHVDAATENAGTASTTSNGSEFKSERSCAVSVGTPSNWKPGNPLPTHIDVNQIASLPNPGSDGWIRVDVTDLARTWAASSGSNDGLVVSSKAQSINDGANSVWQMNHDYDDQECLTAYSVELNITYGL